MELAHKRLTEDAEQRSRQHAAPVDRQTFFRVGDLVRVSTEHLLPDRLSGKFAARWMGPFHIVAHPSVIKNRCGALPVQLKELQWCLYQRLYARADGQHV
jgi:hypothetical protein